MPEGARKDRDTGFDITLFEGESFATRYSVWRPRCTSGQLVNQQDDRTIFVSEGTLFVTVFDGDQPEQKKYLRGGFCQLPHGTKYELATSGSESAELLISEALLYDRHVEQLTEPVAGNAAAIEAPPMLAGPVPTHLAANPVERQNQIDMARALNERRQQQAQQAAAGPAVNANSANVIGVNPRPSIPRE